MKNLRFVTGVFGLVLLSGAAWGAGFGVLARDRIVVPLSKYVRCSFLSADGSELRVQEGIRRNGLAVPPYVGSDVEDLVGWQVDGVTYSTVEFAALAMKADAEATAVTAPKRHVVRFLDSDGVTVFKSSEVEHGAAAVPPTPSKTGFAFVKWDRPYTNVTDDMSVRAVWRGNVTAPDGSHDVTDYSYSGTTSTRFSPLVPNDAGAATDNATYLNRMIKRGGVLYFPAGTYYVGSRIDVGTAGVTLLGDGATIVRTGVSNENSTSYANNSSSGSDWNWAALMMVQKGKLTVRGLTFRYAVPTCFTAEIVAVSGSTQTARLVDGQDADFNANLRFQRIYSFDAKGRPLNYDLVLGSGTELNTHYKLATDVQAGEDGRKTFKLSLGSGKVSVGDQLALCCSTSYSQGIILYGGTSTLSDLVFEDVTVANCFSMTMLVKGVENLTLRRFRVDSGLERSLVTTGMDGIHIARLSGKLLMEECDLNGLADDMLNVHVTAGVVKSVSGTTVTLDSSVESGIFRSGDVVRFYSARMEELGTATLTSGGTASIKVGSLPEGVTAGCLIGNESGLPEVEISGCRFGSTRARGILLQTDKPITVRNSEFHDTRLAGILLSPSATGQWCEMGPIRDAVVSNCTFIACGVGEPSRSDKNNAAVVIRCNHDSDSGSSFATDANRNVRITGNEFRDCVSACVFASNTKGLAVNDNVLWHCGGNVKNYDDRIVRLEYCDTVGITNNVSYASPFLGSNAQSSSKGVLASNNKIWFDVLFRDADGTLLAKSPTKVSSKPTRPAWEANLTTKDGAFSCWRLIGGDGSAYGFSTNITRAIELEAVYAPR